ncbi:hypothetical protein [Actinosynnema sp. NPDC023587]|uniref:hypothetical protein n=1 Tax=Actinosynnema sp. NPDC023587 TaxID=3154695 RepID=UPI0033F9854D
MLHVVLLLVLAALGLLVPALATDQTYWAWSSVGTSAAAALVLIWDWTLRRGSGTAPAAGTTAEQDDHQASADDHPVRGQGGDHTSGSPDQVIEPDEEDTDAADLLTVVDLADEIRVLDERPRYHLAACAWLAGRASLGLPISEARQLGFTPCAVCEPDSTVAAKKRAS